MIFSNPFGLLLQKNRSEYEDGKYVKIQCLQVFKAFCADAKGSKSAGGDPVGVRVSPSAPNLDRDRLGNALYSTKAKAVFPRKNGESAVLKTGEPRRIFPRPSRIPFSAEIGEVF